MAHGGQETQSSGAGAGAGAGGGVLGGITSGIFGIQAARASRDFTKTMMTRRHQWEVRDLRKAGLNPILSATGGAAIGGSAMAPPPHFDVPGGAQKGAEASRTGRVTAEQIKLLREQQNLVSHQAKREENQSWVLNKQGEKLGLEMYAHRARSQADRSELGQSGLYGDRLTAIGAANAKNVDAMATSGKRMINPFTLWY